MKKMKKILSLVLVLVMAFSLVQLATAFTDDDEIQYTEAAAILTEISTIDGYGDGSFGPKREVTRAEAATMIARMMLSRDVADRLPISVSFPDVPSDHWAAKYIAYCAGQRIILGRSDGKFYPNDNVTGSELSVMLLRALNIGDPATYIGASWEMFAILDGMKFKILTTDVEYSKFATREETAQYVFNALTYSASEETKTVTKFQINMMPGSSSPLASATLNKLYDSYAEALAAASGDPAGAQIGADYQIAAITYTETTKVGSIANIVYNLRAGTMSDPYGRPSMSTWVLNGKTIFSKPGSTAKKSYTAITPETVVFADLALTANATASSLVDGKPAGNVAITYNGKGMIGGNGALTEVYVDNDGNITIVIVNTYIGKVNKVEAATAVAKESIVIDADTVSPAGNVKTGNAALANERKFETTGFAKDDVILYTASYNTATDDYTIRSVVAAETISVTPTARTATTFTADGTTYGNSAKAVSTVQSADVTNKSEKVIFVDTYGFAIKVDNPSGTGPQYAVVLATRIAGGSGWTGSGNTYEARLLLGDGTIVETTAVDATTPATDLTTAYPSGTIVNYAERANGVYAISNVTAAGTGNADITRNRVAVTVGGNSESANSRTVFFVETINPAGVSSYKAYTGISAVPTLTATNSNYALNSGVVGAAYILDATVVGGAQQLTDIMYVNFATKDDNNADSRGQYVTYRAVLNGEIVTIESAMPGTFDATDRQKIFASVTVDPDTDLIIAKTELQNALSAIPPVEYFKVSGTGATAGDIVTFGGNSYLSNSDSQFFSIVTTGMGSITEIDASAIVASAKDVVFFTTDGIVTYAFILD